MAGPNGAGKTTVAEDLILGALGIRDFVNADTIALGLSRFDAYEARGRARQVQDEWLRDLIASNRDFAFETTLASMRWEKTVRDAQGIGMTMDLHFLWLPSADDSVKRVSMRVEARGHPIPEDIIRGRYVAGLQNLVSLYMPLMDRWYVYDSSSTGLPVIAQGGLGLEIDVRKAELFETILGVRK